MCQMCWEYFFSFPSPRGLKNTAAWTLSVPFPSVNRCARVKSEHKAARCPVVVTDLEALRRNQSPFTHPRNPWSCVAPVKQIHRLFFDSYLLTTMRNLSKN